MFSESHYNTSFAGETWALTLHSRRQENHWETPDKNPFLSKTGRWLVGNWIRVSIHWWTTWVTLTVKRRERGRVAMIRRMEQKVRRREQRPTLFSHRPGIRHHQAECEGVVWPVVQDKSPVLLFSTSREEGLEKCPALSFFSRNSLNLSLNGCKKRRLWLEIRREETFL